MHKQQLHHFEDILSPNASRTAAGELFRAIAWSQHPLGPVSSWPAALKTTLRILFHSQHPMFIWWGPELYQFYNDAYLPSFGVGKHPDAMGQRGEECWPEIWPIIKPQIDLVMNEGGSTWNENQYVPIFRNGKIENVYWTYGYSPIINDDGSVGGTLVLCTETTPQVLAQQGLEESEARLNLALTSGNIGFWDWDAKSGHIFLSESLMDDWGIDPKTFGNTIPECLARIHPDDRERVWSGVLKATFEARPYDIEYRVVRPNGEEIYVNAKGRFFLNENMQPSRLTGITMNITERKRADLALLHARQEAERSKDEAERANKLKSAFLANMSHEIRTPLGAMLGFADLLRDPHISAAERSNYIDILCRNGEGLSVIINDILDLSKVEAGFLALEYTDTPTAAVVEDIASLFRLKAKDKGLAFDYVIDKSAPTTIVSDPTRVRQVLLNLVGNAIKFTPSGSVKIYVYGTTTKGDRLNLCFDVVDTGIGISDSYRSNIFQPFVQADDTITRRFGGTGLGLALSKSLATSLGGDITLVQTSREMGTTFRFTVADMPENKNYEPKMVSGKDDQTIELNDHTLDGVRVLIVDDAPDNQQLMRKMLNLRGAIVDAAENGSTGYKKALQGDYDIVLMDIQMPEMDGYTATYHLRNQGYRKPIIALTAHAMSEVRQKCLNVGYTAHLPKPINFNDLVTTVARYTSHPVVH